MTPEELVAKLSEAMARKDNDPGGGEDWLDMADVVLPVVLAYAASELEKIRDLIWDDPGPAPRYLANRIKELTDSAR